MSDRKWGLHLIGKESARGRQACCRACATHQRPSHAASIPTAAHALHPSCLPTLLAVLRAGWRSHWLLNRWCSSAQVARACRPGSCPATMAADTSGRRTSAARASCQPWAAPHNSSEANLQDAAGARPGVVKDLFMCGTTAMGSAGVCLAASLADCTCLCACAAAILQAIWAPRLEASTCTPPCAQVWPGQEERKYQHALVSNQQPQTCLMRSAHD